MTFLAQRSLASSRHVPPSPIAQTTTKLRPKKTPHLYLPSTKPPISIRISACARVFRATTSSKCGSHISPVIPPPWTFPTSFAW
ncbi:hypothetical protein GMOD_00007459 [Pyrenophora seminiperda CCB06]|uniref:Uncharacterized protein n=1 Tax=Pyrenophora seminiperda CCB06 TaxID=1302712 RepID=A0A3M7MD75_9PLEO|nr:hypothetical protein GMOD_00007459 [Pyrenophora seminiperda CCB06]